MSLFGLCCHPEKKRPIYPKVIGSVPFIFILEDSRLPLKVILPQDLVLGHGSTGPSYQTRRILRRHPAENHCLSFCRVRCLL